MKNCDLIEQLHKEMSGMPCDAKAESLLALAIKKKSDFADFVVHCDSLFYREYSRDVVSADVKEDVRKSSVLELHLSRSGIYDHLPEGLFFQPTDARSKLMSAGQMAMDYKINKQKEQDIRRFFLPIENELFWQRLQLEIEENTFLEGLHSGIINEYFKQFWNIPSAIPEALCFPMILLLPHANKLAGDLPLTAQCLEHILHETVKVTRVPASVTETQSLFGQSLSNHQLGTDTICGEQFLEDYPVLEFTIGPLKKSGVTEYLEGGKRFHFLQTFYGFFVPAIADIITKIEVSTEEKAMELKADKEPILGYSSAL